MIYKTYYDSPIGKLMIVGDSNNIIGTWVEGQKYFGGNLSENISQEDGIPVFIKTKLWFDRYFSGEIVSPKELYLAPFGSHFRHVVWNTLLEIPYGEITTYGAIAKKVAKILNKDSISAQAIGGAIGHNPLLIIIPCHRVIGANGNLTGYAGGIDKKLQLLKLEGVNL